MEFSRWILDQWQRKGVALIAALIIWLFVNHSIIETKMIPNIAIKIVNLPADKAIQGLQSNGLLTRRISLTLSGTKSVINDLEASDIEVVLDASTADRSEWVVTINKKNLISLNPSINLANHITQVDHPEFVIKIGQLTNGYIPIRIVTPIGSAPQGYRFLDIWPQTLQQSFSGTEEELLRLTQTGLELRFNLDKITKSELDAIKQHGEEVAFTAPNSWKKLIDPIEGDVEEEINDPQAKHLQLYFEPLEWHLLEMKIPLHIYYPVDSLKEYNPLTTPLKQSESVIFEEGVPLFTPPLYLFGSSAKFLKAIQPTLEIAVVTRPNSDNQLPWNLQVTNLKNAEQLYFKLMQQGGHSSEEYEKFLRRRFYRYLRGVIPYEQPDQKLHINSNVEADKITIHS